MLSDKELKNKLKPYYQENYKQFYPAKFLEEQGFFRNVCIKTGLPFWSTDKDRKISGDPQAGNAATFIGEKNTKHKLSFVDVWKKFSELFVVNGYTPIDRYPTVARWNPTMEFTNASIAAFQPYVISGEVKPPANPLVIPQFCVRFPDLDNVGISGQHCTGFIMIGQHMFVNPDQWDQEKVFAHMFQYFTQGLGVDKNDIIFHEDAWAGGGNVGCCVEFFSKGVELANQVYMLSEQNEKGEVEDLKIKVLDMGMGMERVAWFSQATPTIYDAIYPEVVSYLCEKTNYRIDKDLQLKFVPFASKLNMDEVEDIDQAWREVADLSQIPLDQLKADVVKMSGIYSIADHTRTLLFVLNDGGLPSNSGGSYMLRVILRRCLDFISKYDWGINLNEVIDLHAKLLEPLFPELKENLETVHKIVDVEIEKYEQTKIKAKGIIQRLIDSGEVEFISEDKLIELYDSNGISPELIKNAAKEGGFNLDIPSDFFSKVAGRHEQVKQVHASESEINLDLSDLADTQALYFDDYKKLQFSAKIIKIIDNYVVLDKTYFYPTSGGQLHDLGKLADHDLVNVFKQSKFVVHELNSVEGLNIGDTVACTIDKDRRIQLAQNHSAAHILNAAAKKVLGPHINQAGAKKTVEKAHLDVTHFKAITKEEEKQIETYANDLIKNHIDVESTFLSRTEAEQKFGMEIYQGGAVPGDTLRIVDIIGTDVEACGGTHVKNTAEVEKIKILKTSKIQDGVVRITFVAGSLALNLEKGDEALLDSMSTELNCTADLIVGRVEELFSKWKKAKKNYKKKKMEEEAFQLLSTDSLESDVISDVKQILRVQPEKIIDTIKRFKTDLESFKKLNAEQFE